MSIKVVNDTNSGSAIIKAPNSAGDFNIITPAFSTELAPRMQLMIAQNSTSGTSIDFTGIPSWAKKITVMFNGVSTSGTSLLQVQLGTSGGVQTSGYASCVQQGASAAAGTAGLIIRQSQVANGIYSGHENIINISNNVWIGSGVLSDTTNLNNAYSSGSVTLSSTLDRIRVTTVNGTDTFDAGQINVLYEG